MHFGVLQEADGPSSSSGSEAAACSKLEVCTLCINAASIILYVRITWNEYALTI